jgi:protein gp37
MADRTHIEWCDSTFNPWIGCTKVSPACDHCYAEADMDLRRHRVKWGAGELRSRTSEANWRQPLRWNAERFWECRSCGWRGVAKYGVRVVCGTCEVPAELTRQRVFCASLADVFDNEIDPQWRADLFDLIAATPNLDWLLLTKRIGNVASMVPAAWRPLFPRNVWLGATIANQAEADRDIPKLLATPARVRFLSIEPLLEPVRLPRVDFHCDLCGGTGILGRWPRGKCHHCLGRGYLPAISTDPQFGSPKTPMRMVDWVIVGGESGTRARPANPQWIRDLRDQCVQAKVPFLFKQWGERVSVSEVEGVGPHHMFPDGRTVRRVGKKRAGRTLDGVEHNGFPEVRA